MTVVGFVAAFVANSMKLVGSGLIGNFTYPCFGGTISRAELKKLRRCGSFDLSGPIIYQRL
jgi:hypothetical protein